MRTEMSVFGIGLNTSHEEIEGIQESNLANINFLVPFEEKEFERMLNKFSTVETPFFILVDEKGDAHYGSIIVPDEKKMFETYSEMNEYISKIRN